MEIFKLGDDILALLSGCVIVFLLYEKIGLTFSCYVAVPKNLIKSAFALAFARPLKVLATVFLQVRERLGFDLLRIKN